MLKPARASIIQHTRFALVFAGMAAACSSEIVDDSTRGNPSNNAGNGSTNSASHGGNGNPSAGGGSGNPVTNGGATNPSAGSSNTASGGNSVPGSGGTTASNSCATPSPLPFRVMTRLNRAEYDNTVRDLLGDTGHLPLTSLPGITVMAPSTTMRRLSPSIPSWSRVTRIWHKLWRNAPWPRIVPVENWCSRAPRPTTPALVRSRQTSARALGAVRSRRVKSTVCSAFIRRLAPADSPSSRAFKRWSRER